MPPRAGASIAPPLVEDLERELKFAVPIERADHVRHWLESLCRPDAQHPDADVWTIYYDTPALASLDEKLNSDYLKMKVRVRWYSPPGGVARGPAFIEIKRRVGNRREKTRLVLPMSAAELAGRALDDKVFAALPRLLAPTGTVLDASWQPMLALRYRRRRYVEVMSGARISFDTDIRATALNHRYLVARAEGPLRIAVVEVKGLSDVLPARLRPLIALGIRKQSLSKYAVLGLHVARRIF
jgi:hypothetical protein